MVTVIEAMNKESGESFGSPLLIRPYNSSARLSIRSFARAMNPTNRILFSSLQMLIQPLNHHFEHFRIFRFVMDFVIHPIP